MKILKPGKVEQRKFVCDECKCVFVVDSSEVRWLLDYYVSCPCCQSTRWWNRGEPYEEPVQDTQTEKERLYGILLTANPNATTTELTDHLIANGVTFREV